MLDAERAAHEWSRLNDRERGALQFLLSADEHKLPLAKYARLFGDIRQMGAEKRAREKPHLNPLGNAEILYYRGLIGVAYDQAAAGAAAFRLCALRSGGDFAQPRNWLRPLRRR